MRNLTLLFLIVFSLTHFVVQAQNITGPTSVVVGQTYTYTFNNGASHFSYGWQSSNGGITTVSTWSSGTTYYASIKWNTPGTASLYFINYSGGGQMGSLSVTTAVGAPDATYNFQQNCGSTVITRTTNPPSGVNWYWQTTAAGTSTTNSSTTYTVSTAQTYYLRARWGTTGAWSSTSQSITGVTITSPLAAPASSTPGNQISDVSTSVAVTVATVSGATGYAWFDVPTGGTAIAGITATTHYPVLTPGGSTTLYVASVNGPCLSTTRRSVMANLYVAPVITSTSNELIFGTPVTLSVNNFAFDTYQWLDGNNNAISGATSSSYSVTFAGTYKVRVTKNGSAPFTSASKTISSQNYIRTIDILVPGVTTETALNALSATSKQQSTTFFDGLGRPIQSVIQGNSPSGKDLVQAIAYDPFGREPNKYLPYTDGTNGWIKANALKDPNTTATTELDKYRSGRQYDFYQNTTRVAQDQYPYSETLFEPSPLNRPDKDYGAGAAWQTNNKFIQHGYLINQHGTGSSTTQEKIIAWDINGSGMPVRAAVVSGYVVSGGYYANGQLSIKSTKDEQGNEVREYTNKSGQVILKKVQAAASTNLNSTTEWALTYYLYDDLGNLRYVLPPELSKLIHDAADTYVVTTTNLDTWAFQYKYDGRRRMSEKKVPGAGWVYLVYDKRDRLVLTQDANQRAQATKYWSFTKYDELNRPIMTGIKDTTATLTQATMQGVVDTYYNNMTSTTWRKWGESYIGNAPNNVHGYSNKSYPVRTGGASEVDVNKYLTATYYDNYDFRSLWNGTYTYENEMLQETASYNGYLYTQPATENTRVTGQVTGTKTKVLDGGPTGGYTWLKAVTYYDEKYRVVQTISDNYKGGVERVTQVLDFTGKVLKSKLTHSEADLQWKDLVNVRLEGNKVISTATGSTWGNSGAASVQQLAAGQNGWVEFTYTATNTERAVGLADANPNANFNSINYAVLISNPIVNPNAAVYESGVSKYGIPTQIKAGDVIRIERTGTTVTYKINGTIVYTSTVASNGVLMADIALNYPNSSVAGARASFATTTKSITRRLEYDHAGRLLKTWHKLNSDTEILLALNEYNELGQLVDKKLHSTVSNGSNAKQSVDYRYNIRGWLTSMNDASLANTSSTTKTNDDAGDLFGFNLHYTTTDLGNTPLYNGNISAMEWSNNLGVGAVKQNGYVYTYDALNRIKTSVFREKTTTWSTPANNALQETGFNYDLNGNITTLQRNDKRATGWMDNLSYTYTGNQLMRVIDSGDANAGFLDGQPGTGNDYTYDANGNMTRDLNKGIGTTLSDNTNLITYNYLNLPETVTKGNNNVRYIYDAGGRKLTQVTSFGGQQKQVDYVGEFQYENDQLQFISHEEGRIAIAANKTIYTHDGSSTTDITPVTSALAAVTQNTYSYVRATASGTTAKQGMFPIGGTIAVAPGEQYRIRAKGYRTATNTNTVHLYIRTNSTDLSWPGGQLATGQPAEAWTEQIITIPAGHTTLQAGVVWNTVANGEQFFLNDFEITKLSANAAPEYQYNLKDHLGNVRLSFTSKEEIETTTATYETANLNAEQSQYVRMDNAKRINSSLFDRTIGVNPSTTPGYAQRLNGSANERYGIARSLSVMPGDVVHAEVYAKYIDPNSSNWTTALANLVSQINANTAGVVIDGTNYTTSTSSFPAGMLGHQTTNDNGAPRAYLNWLVFDRNYVFITGGFKQITTAAKEAGTDVPHELIAMPAAITITQPGYVYIYLSNENSTPVEVFFDEFKVTHTKTPVIQSDDYYPFGLTFNSYQRENATTNKYLYNGIEKATDLDLGWYTATYRTLDPTIGRWIQIDPMVDDFYSFTPYNSNENNPIKNADPNGDCPWCVGALLGAAVEYGTQVATNLVKGDDLGDALFNNVDFADVALSGLEGGITGGASVGRKLLVNVATEVVKASIDVSGDGRTDVVGTEGSSKSVKSVVTEATVSVVANKAGEKGGKALIDNSSTKAVKAATSNVNATSKNLQKSINTTANGNLNSKAKTTTTAYKDYTKAQSNLQKTKALNQTVGKVNGNVVKGTTDVATGTAGSAASDELNKKKN
ncbi:MAG: hypothetical protein KF775_04500 [Cyclobacteriaceae bacterium]|nr:hypothetical protein [Cyclobacteriaceae bacterium]